MHLPAKIWSCLSYVANILTLSTFNRDGSQQPLGGHNIHAQELTDLEMSRAAGYPIFMPPGGRRFENGTNFVCEYQEMKDWEPCSTSDNRQCWLRHKVTGKEYNIFTNYEEEIPIGKTRSYYFNITDGTINADGLAFESGKLVNNQYPGPYVQAVSIFPFALAFNRVLFTHKQRLFLT